MFGPSAKPLSGRYLSFAEREEIALMRAQGFTMQGVARHLGRAASTISRELRRPPAAVAWSIGLRPRNGILNDRPDGPSWRSLRAILPCGPTCRSVWPE